MLCKNSSHVKIYNFLKVLSYEILCYLHVKFPNYYFLKDRATSYEAQS